VTIVDAGATGQSPQLIGTSKAYYRFTSTAATANTIVFDRDTEVRVLVVGGGGSGGCRSGGGGGAGAAVRTSVLFYAGVAYTIQVGNGGASRTTMEIGFDGSESKITYSSGSVLILAKGGGAGGRTNQNANNGGSGGGGGSDWPIGTYGAPGAAVTTNVPAIAWGNRGGSAASSGSPCNGNSNKCYCGAGGGGAGSPGLPSTQGASEVGCTSGAGGSGVSDDITGSAVIYAGGGGGACHTSAVAAGSGGSGGGGAGGKGTTGIAGTANTGGGGGGGGYTDAVDQASGAGGSGVVILQWTQGQIAKQVWWFTGTAVEWRVPAGVRSLNMRMWGGGGAGYSRIQPDSTALYYPEQGGSGGYVSGDIAVNQSSYLYYAVGGGGLASIGGRMPQTFPNGGSGGLGSGTGGGRSQISIFQTQQASPNEAITVRDNIIMIAGAGGSAGQKGQVSGNAGACGRAGGGLEGNDDNGTYNFRGTQVSGGVCPSNQPGCICLGSPVCLSHSGGFLSGGAAFTINGAGGDGYYGGSAGKLEFVDPVYTVVGGGAGGSSYTHPSVTNVVNLAGTDNGGSAPNFYDPDNNDMFGKGGPRDLETYSQSSITPGKPGLIVVRYQCGPGYYMTVGSTSCTACPSGKFSNLTGASVCSSCPAGLYGGSAGATALGDCSPCAAGTFGDADTCTACGAGLWSATGSTSASACIGCAELNGSAISAGKGVETTDVPGYRVHSYKTTGATSVTFSRDVVADVLVVGGGGSGGINIGGGGGAGAVVFYSGYKFVQGTTYAFSVGAGGLEASGTGTPTAGYGNAGNAGSESSIKVGASNIFLASCGGNGGSGGGGTCASIAVTNGVLGGSGGGAGGCSAGSNSPGFASAANAMSSMSGYTTGTAGGTNWVSSTSANIAAGGGGGAGTAGAGAASAAPGTGGHGIYRVGWAGTNLVLASAFGSAYTSIADFQSGDYYIAGGGGGGGWGTTDALVSGGYGGSGKGVTGTGSLGPTAAAANTGSGGGGGSVGVTKKGGAGGSGLILLRYTTCQPCGAGTKLDSPGVGGTCTSCELGKYSGNGATVCQACPLHSSADVGSDKCYANVGKYPRHVLASGETFKSEVINLARSCGADGRSACSTVSKSIYESNSASYGPQLANNGLFSSTWIGTFITGEGSGATAIAASTNNWWRVDFSSRKSIIGGKIFMPLAGTDTTTLNRMNNFKIWIGDQTSYNDAGPPANINCYTHSGMAHHVAPYTATFSCIGSGRYLFVHVPDNTHLNMNEIEVYPLLTSTVAINQLLVVNNDFVSDTFWGLSGSVAIAFPLWMHPTVLLGSPQVPPSISDNDYPVVTDSLGAVVRPYVWYKFDTGTSCKNDVGENAFVLTNNGGTIADCSTARVKRGDKSALFVQASNNNFKFPSTAPNTMALPTMQGNSGLTISFWGLMTTSSDANAIFVDLSKYPSTGNANAYFIVYRTNTDKITFYTNQPSTVQYEHTVALVDSTWHFYVWSIDTTANSNAWTIWIDNVRYVCASGCGALGGSKSQALPAAPGSGSTDILEYFLGSCRASCRLDGNIDDFRIYKGVLTSAQVTTLYQGRVGVYTAAFGDCPDASACSSGSKHCDKFGAKLCCGPGTFFRDGLDTACQPCPAGTFSSDGAGTSCTSCAAGKFSTGVGMTHSSACSECKVSGAYSTLCNASQTARCTSPTTNVCCGSNQYYTDGFACKSCPASTYVDDSLSFCRSPCPPGQYWDTDTCFGCPTGMYSTAPSI